MGHPYTVRDIADVVAAIYMACPAATGTSDAEHRIPPALDTALRTYIRISEAQGVEPPEWGKALRDAIEGAQQVATSPAES